MSTKRIPISGFQNSMQRIRERLQGQKSATLSFAGRIVLLMSLVHAMPLNILSHGWVPKAVINSIDRECQFSMNNAVF